MTSPVSTICFECGNAVDASLLGGVCPRCLLGDVVGGEGESKGADFDGHELLGEIARGGMGVVYRARQLEPERMVALKTLRAASLDSPEAMARFRHESEVMVALDHAAILPVYHCGEQDGIPFFTMKLVEGGTLAERVESYSGKWREIAALMTILCDGVRHAHERGVLHRDLKPANVLFDTAGQAYVSDFGIAKLSESTQNAMLTMTMSVIGTPHYLAPEIAAGSVKAASVSSDVWSLGVIMYELITGERPFKGESVTMVLRALDTADAASPQKLRADVPRDLEVIVMKALSRDPARRYASAHAFADDLRAWLDGRPIAARAVPAHERAWMWARRNPRLASTAALLVVAVIAAVAALVWGFVRVSQENARVLASEEKTRAHLRESLLLQARSGREAAMAGWRAAGLDALRKANEILGGDDVRDEAVAHLAGFDLYADEKSMPAYFSPDFDWQARQSGANTLEVTGPDDAGEPWRITNLRGTMSAKFDSGARWVAAQSPQHGVDFYDLRTRQLAHHLPPGNSVMEFSHDGTAVCVNEASGVRVLRTDDCSEAAALPRDPAEQSTFAFNAATSLPFVARVTRAQLVIVDWHSGKVVATMSNPLAQCPLRMMWQNESLLVTASDGLVHAINVTGNFPGVVAQERGGIMTLCAERDGPLLLASSQARDTSLWHMGQRQILARLPGWAANALCSDDTRFTASGMNSCLARIVHPACIAFVSQRFLPAVALNESDMMDCSPDGRLLVASSASRLIVREVATRRLLLVEEMRERPGVRLAAFLSGGDELLLITTKNAEVRKLAREGDHLTLRRDRELPLPEGAMITDACLSADRTRAVLLLQPGKMLHGAVRDFAGWRECAVQGRVPGDVLTVSSDGRWIAAKGVSFSSGIAIVNTGAEAGVSAADLPMGAPFFSADSRWLTVAGNDGVLRVYETETWKIVHERAITRRGMVAVGTGAWDAGGGWFASAVDSECVEIIEAGTWRRAALLRSPLHAAIVSVEIAPGGQHLFVRRQGGGMERWDLRSLARELSQLGIEMKLPSSAPPTPASPELAAPFADAVIPPLIFGTSAGEK